MGTPRQNQESGRVEDLSPAQVTGIRTLWGSRSPASGGQHETLAGDLPPVPEGQDELEQPISSPQDQTVKLGDHLTWLDFPVHPDFSLAVVGSLSQVPNDGNCIFTAMAEAVIHDSSFSPEPRATATFDANTARAAVAELVDSSYEWQQ
eukprot:5805379-Heterocapsa_arctica.AAC.1